MNKKATNAIKYSLSFILAAILVYFAFSKVNWEAFMSGLGSTRWNYIVLFAIASVLALVFRNARWRLLMKPLDPEVKGLDSWDATNIGNVANIAIPGAGEFIRCGYMSSKRMSYDKTFGTMVCERAWDVICILVLILIALAAKWKSFGAFFRENILGAASGRFTLSFWIVAFTAMVVAAGFIYLVYRFREKNRLCGKIASVVSGLWDGIISFTKVSNKLLFVVYTVGVWVSYVLMSYFIILSMPSLDGLGLADAVLISAMGNIASVIPVPGGIGAYHYIVALTLQSLYGADWDTGLLFATLNHELHALLVIALGVISYFRLSTSRRHHEIDNSR